MRIARARAQSVHPRVWMSSPAPWVGVDSTRGQRASYPTGVCGEPPGQVMAVRNRLHTVVRMSTPRTALALLLMLTGVPTATTALAPPWNTMLPAPVTLAGAGSGSSGERVASDHAAPRITNARARRAGPRLVIHMRLSERALVSAYTADGPGGGGWHRLAMVVTGAGHHRLVVRPPLAVGDRVHLRARDAAGNRTAVTIPIGAQR